ncbi:MULTISPECIES: 2-hydroxyacid dehydrogenase [Streptomyces]|uniref:2-hydroxyacid dehydrogenase n=1 Tax=Streptomyces TaxID=1883 RepID=UPI000F735ABC|nr:MULTISPECIES: 2-hydroxyacid dehydrogenase [Streptomyces]RSR96814.1 dihydrofolate reductase [Streptomyces sp. WAC00469]WTD46476.1 2-hydroxyacid dehydrogenase [Streptomyces thermoviolaceus]GGV67014.1 dehydrogenase [Streptomyces thermoviolaceus subsp. apingens]GHA77443.1 dehydrogenase [Streptomyces thermoviolaceus subsp. thermoviolaceus]
MSSAVHHTATGVLLPWDGLDRRYGPWPEGVQVHVWDGTTPDGEPADEVLAQVGLWVMPYAVPDAARLLPRLPRLRAVQSLSAGVEKLLPLLPAGVALHNGRGLHDASTAEHALGLILAAQRDLPQWVADQADGRWEPHFTRSLADCRVTIVGYGSIGAALERRLLACEAQVVRVARRARPEQDVHAVSDLPGLLPDTDIVVLVLPENASTAGLFGAAELAALPDGALVVNVGRGRTLDTEALLAHTSTGRLRAALDVTDPEPLPADHPLRRCPGVLITPHVAGGSAAFRPRAERLIVEQVRRFADGRELLHPFPRD